LVLVPRRKDFNATAPPSEEEEECFSVSLFVFGGVILIGGK
jgi:hypothetical protein